MVSCILPLRCFPCLAAKAEERHERHLVCLSLSTHIQDDGQDSRGAWLDQDWVPERRRLEGRVGLMLEKEACKRRTLEEMDLQRFLRPYECGKQYEGVTSQGAATACSWQPSPSRLLRNASLHHAISEARSCCVVFSPAETSASSQVRACAQIRS